MLKYVVINDDGEIEFFNKYLVIERLSTWKSRRHYFDTLEEVIDFILDKDYYRIFCGNKELETF